MPACRFLAVILRAGFLGHEDVKFERMLHKLYLHQLSPVCRRFAFFFFPEPSGNSAASPVEQPGCPPHEPKIQRKDETKRISPEDQMGHSACVIHLKRMVLHFS